MDKDYTFGYDTAIRQFWNSPEDLTNPFTEGTEKFDGFEYARSHLMNQITFYFREKVK